MVQLNTAFDNGFNIDAVRATPTHEARVAVISSEFVNNPVIQAAFNSAALEWEKNTATPGWAGPSLSQIVTKAVTQAIQ
jgi:hypothetical protein